jgi:septal ring-binding cell division protein DamX
MHDLDRMKTKVEIRLGPGQLFGLAVGTTVFSALLFAAGFMVGKGQVPTVAPEADLGRLLDVSSEESVVATPVAAAVGEVEFLFPNALGSRPGVKAKTQKVIRLGPTRLLTAAPQKAVSKRVKPVPLKQRISAPSKPVVITAARTPAPKRVDSVKAIPKPKVTAQTVPKKAPVRPSKAQASPALSEDAPSPRRVFAAPKVASAVKKAIVKQPARTTTRKPVARVKPVTPRPAAAPRVTVKKPKAVAKAPRTTARQAKPVQRRVKNMGRARFTLQVKATRVKAEADRFVKELQIAGFYPHRILVAMPGKGRFYRIRVGRFETIEEARAFQESYASRSGMNDSGFVTRL